MDLPITGCATGRVRRLGHQVEIELSGSYLLVIEVPFTVAVAGHPVPVDPQDRAGGLAPDLHSLAGRTVAGATSSSGFLRVEWAGGATLEVPAHDRYEAWHLRGPGSYMTVCMPGGELGVWSGDGL